MKKHPLRTLKSPSFQKAFFVLFLVSATMICSFFSFSSAEGWQDFATPLVSIEAENATVGPNANVYGPKVGNMGQWSGKAEGYVIFEDLDLEKDGEYLVKVHYMSGSDDRYYLINAAGIETKLPCPNTGSFDTVGSVLVTLQLEAGGDLRIGSDYYAPDLDKIEIFEKDAFVFPERSYVDGENVTVAEKLVLDTKNGVFSIFEEGKAVVNNAHGEAFIDGKTISTDDFKKHEYKDNCDGSVTFFHDEHPDFEGTITQTFTVKDGYILLDLMVMGKNDTVLSTNYVSPLSVYKEGIEMEQPVFLQIPFDNDKWVEPKFIAGENLGFKTTSYEVAAYYDEGTGTGLVLGSVRHDTWKTGIDVYSAEGTFMGLSVYGGAADYQTRDLIPHGSVSGKSVSAPTVFVGYYEDYREGLTAFAKANTDVVPAKESVKDVPFGYNSWGSMQGSVNFSNMVAVSTYINSHLQESWQTDGAPVYVNIDSYWDYLVQNDYNLEMTLDEALAAFAAICKENNQKAGIYFTPFATWLSSEEALKNTKMPGSDYTYYDAALRLPDGSLYGKGLADGYALDPTHPGTIAYIEQRMNYFIELGFEYVKLDFLSHGALEGDHYDKSITTGIQAYNSGMKRIHELAGDKLFINLSIAPVFPYQYADGRRISCDAFGSVSNTQHVLSYLSACFFEKELYAYPDPDHIVVLGQSEGVARMRVTSGAISGTSFLIGDDLSKIAMASADHERILAMYGNKDVISVIKLGATFTPIDAGAGKRCATTYYHKAENGKVYLALFNFDGGDNMMQVDLTALDAAFADGFAAKELWSGNTFGGSDGDLVIDVAGEDAVLIELTLKDGGLIDPPTPSESQSATKTPSAEPSAPTSSESKPTDKDKDLGKDDGISPLLIGAIIGGVVIVAAAAGAVVVIGKKKKA